MDQDPANQPVPAPTTPVSPTSAAPAWTADPARPTPVAQVGKPAAGKSSNARVLNVILAGALVLAVGRDRVRCRTHDCAARRLAETAPAAATSLAARRFNPLLRRDRGNGGGNGGGGFAGLGGALAAGGGVSIEGTVDSVSATTPDAQAGLRADDPDRPRSDHDLPFADQCERLGHRHRRHGPGPAQPPRGAGGARPPRTATVTGPTASDVTVVP